MKEKIYNIGQKLVFSEDTEQKKGISDKSIIVKKGTPVFVGADKGKAFVHYLNEDIQPLGENAKVDGYSVSGLAEWIYEYINRNLPVDIGEVLEDYDIEVSEFKEKIAWSLEELGMYDHTGNSN